MGNKSRESELPGKTKEKTASQIEEGKECAVHPRFSKGLKDSRVGTNLNLRENRIASLYATEIRREGLFRRKKNQKKKME